jgi:hypothetical protein
VVSAWDTVLPLVAVLLPLTPPPALVLEFVVVVEAGVLDWACALALPSLANSSLKR